MSQNAFSLQVGSTADVTISGGGQPYSVVGGTSAIAQIILSGSVLTAIGVGTGTDSVNVYSAQGGCTNLRIAVGSNGALGVTLNPSEVTVSVGGSALVSLSGASSYYLSGNIGSNIATVAVSGAVASVAGLSPGSAWPTICGSGASCVSLPITVRAVSVSTGTSNDSSAGSLVSG